ncbi:MAG: hypothetical protein IT379_06240, partial [Deltaproteobacteria bacterium]|nr:hypothetical protein [Deltaproteobacteria bacterium]
GNRLHRVAIREGAELEDLSALLDMAIEPMEITDDRDASFSPDGRLIAASVSRGSCVGWSCVWLGPSDDPSAMRPIRVDIEPDALLHASWPVVADDARFVVYESAGATAEHHYDVWITHRGDGGDYGPPVVLSAASTRPYNKRPRLSPDQTRVVFSCSFEIYGYDSICEVGTDGTGFRILLSPDQAPPPYVALRDESLDHPSYAPDGSIVFATRWGVGSQIWRLPADGGLPERVHLADLHELTQPCVLPDGRIVAVHDLSAEAPGTTLAVLEPDGALAFEIAPTWVPGQYTWLTGCGP